MDALLLPTKRQKRSLRRITYSSIRESFYRHGDRSLILGEELGYWILLRNVMDRAAQTNSSYWNWNPQMFPWFCAFTNDSACLFCTFPKFGVLF